MPTVPKLVDLALNVLVDHKALEPVLLDVKRVCSFTDYFLICSGTSNRHVAALAEHLEETLRGAGFRPLGMEGVPEGQWALLDYNDLVIHIFLQPLREFYNLEGLWAEASRTWSVSPAPKPAPAAAFPETPAAPPDTD